MNYKLILLKDGRNILIGDEEIKNENYFINKHGQISQCVKALEIWLKENNSPIKKIIAGIEPLPTITYSSEVKQILRDKYGWVDIIYHVEILSCRFESCPCRKSYLIMAQNKKKPRKLSLRNTDVICLLRETAMRNRIAFPENEEDEKWFNEGVKKHKSGDFMERLFNALKLGRTDS